MGFERANPVAPEVWVITQCDGDALHIAEKAIAVAAKVPNTVAIVGDRDDAPRKDHGRGARPGGMPVTPPSGRLPCVFTGS